jgi:GNAT superfamily N-acetyltransferase
LEVRRISAQDTYSIRQKMLRVGRPFHECKFEGDTDDQTFHLGAFIESKLVSIASFYFERNSDLDEPYQFKLRGMATLAEYQRQGLSSSLLSRGFPIVKQNLCNLVWCFARTEASGFYEKNGFIKYGKSFPTPHIGDHVLMIKYLNSDT